MSEAGLQLRCLASTRVTEHAWQEQEARRDNENGSQANAESSIKEDLASGSGLNLEALRLSVERSNQIEVEDQRQPRSISTATSNPDFESDAESVSNESSYTLSLKQHNEQHISCIQEAQTSPDKTCIFTSDFDHTFSVYAIDASVPSGSLGRPLKPYAQFTSSDPIWAFAANPLFDVNDANTSHVLVSRRDRYITLHNALWDVSRTYDNTDSTLGHNKPVNIATPITSYKLINNLTEAVVAPLSLSYSHSGTHFFAGHQNAIATFDLEYCDAPVHKISTIPSARSKLKGGGRGFKGWISALSLSPPSTFAQGGLLAAGSRTRYVGIYDATSGEEVTTFSLPGTIDGKKLSNANMRHVMGDGASYLKYSPCGTYLYVAERQSDVLLIYDVRNFSLTLGYCAGRKALTKQKLGFDIWNAGASPYDIEAMSHEVWAGGTDGMVRVWRDPYRKEGAVEADDAVQIGDGDTPVVGTIIHPSGGLAVAACGKIEVGDDLGMKGRAQGGRGQPKFRQWGSLDILALCC
jgi:hypothetical protein